MAHKKGRQIDNDHSIQTMQRFNQSDTFFILGMGRSGTNFLAAMLSRSKSRINLIDAIKRRYPNALLFHEPIDEDFDALVGAHESYDSALQYFRNVRLEKMLELIEGHDFRHYGEVNSNLRFHAKAIKVILPRARLLYVVRDGREVVRSIMARLHYTADSTSHFNLQPLPSDPLYESWEGLSRFAKVCWLWADANRRLAEDVPDWVKFESLIGNYDYFRRNLLNFLGLEMSEPRWRALVGVPTNITKQFTFPPWQEWDTSQRAAFDAICGEQMARYGYTDTG